MDRRKLNRARSSDLFHLTSLLMKHYWRFVFGKRHVWWVTENERFLELFGSITITHFTITANSAETFLCFLCLFAAIPSCLRRSCDIMRPPLSYNRNFGR